MSDISQIQVSTTTYNIKDNTARININSISTLLNSLSTSLSTMAFIGDAPSDDKDYTRKNGDWHEFSGGGGGSESYSEATSTSSGLMSAADKQYLDELSNNISATTYIKKFGQETKYQSLVLTQGGYYLDMDNIASNSTAPNTDQNYASIVWRDSKTPKDTVASLRFIQDTNNKLGLALFGGGGTGNKLFQIAYSQTTDGIPDEVYYSISNPANFRSAIGITDIALRPNYELSTVDLTDGVSELEAGKLYFYYEV